LAIFDQLQITGANHYFCG